ncbi:MAG: TonB-dependent receptor plug domain-containing protein [Caldithrix sp.]|nr:TonB-dependent receptor plug domain-containing protein [Caldithrix sp.]
MGTLYRVIVKFFLIWFLMLFSVTSMLAQSTGTIQGKVLDSKTREPLVGVNVSVEDYALGASTDGSGRYVISNVPTGTRRLVFSYVGYKDRNVTDVMVMSTRPAVLNVQLDEKVFESDAITVTAGYFVEEEKTQTSTIGLSREEIRRFPGGFEDVVRTVSTLPGVAISGNNGRNDLLVRGGGPSENLFIVNNIEVPNINHFGTQGASSGTISFINLDFVDNVTFSTGGFSARYGDKMSSVLELDLTEGRSDRFGGKGLISATQFGLNAEGPVGNNGNFLFSSRKSYLDFIFKAAGLPFVPVYTDFNFLANYTMPNNDRITVIGLAAIDQVDRNMSSVENRVVNAGILDNTQYQWIGGIDYRHSLSSGYINITANYNLNQYRFSQADTQLVEYFNSQSDENEIGLKIQHFWALNKKISLFSGLQNKWISNDNTVQFADVIYDRNGNRVTTSELGLPKFSDEQIQSAKTAAFLEILWSIHPKFSMNTGLRYDRYPFLNQPDYIAPRLAAKYQHNNRLSFKLSGGRYYQSPSYVWLINSQNKKLKALQNDMVVGGIDYLFRADMRAALEIFYKDYSQLPTGTIPGVTDYVVITNTGANFGGRDNNFQSFGFFPLVSSANGFAYGMEWLLQKRFSDIPVYGQFSLTFSESRFTAGNDNSYFSPFDQRFVLNLSGGYIINDHWEISGKFRYFTGLPYTPVYRPSENPSGEETIQNLPEEYLSARLPDGHHLDVRVDRYFNFKRWTLIAFIDIQNIYNYQLPLRPSYNFWEDKVETSSSIGILPSIGLSIEY